MNVHIDVTMFTMVVFTISHYSMKDTLHSYRLWFQNRNYVLEYIHLTEH